MHGRKSPLHLAGELDGVLTLRPSIKALFKAFDARDPPPNSQKAATRRLLEDLAETNEPLGETSRHTADLVIGAYFFAMRACEFCKTEKKGKTKLLTLDNITFRDKKRKIVDISEPDLTKRARYVTVCFVDQKNGKKNEKRTQRKTGRKWLCPVRAWGRACQRANTKHDKKRPEQPVCIFTSKNGRQTQITDSQVIQSLRTSCKVNGGRERYGFGPEEIGSRSIRSGAAMSLFIANHSTERIKILGRWRSDAFLAYIRPQVLEWTNLMARDMASKKDFIDLGFQHQSSKRTTNPDNLDELGTTFPTNHQGRRRKMA